MKKSRVTLTVEERESLSDLIRAGKASALVQAHARVLLKADQAEGGPAWIDGRIAEAVVVDVATVERIRRRFVEQGLESALRRKPQEAPGRPRKIDGAAEARLVALACSAPPEGRKSWTMKLLAERLVELEVVESIGAETVRAARKKTRRSPGCASNG